MMNASKARCPSIFGYFKVFKPPEQQLRKPTPLSIHVRLMHMAHFGHFMRTRTVSNALEQRASFLASLS